MRSGVHNRFAILREIKPSKLLNAACCSVDLLQSEQIVRNNISKITIVNDAKQGLDLVDEVP